MLVSRKLRVVLSVVVLGAAASACGPKGTGGDGTTGPSKQPVMGKTSPEAWAAVKKNAERDLEQCEAKTADADKKLTEVNAKFSGKANDAMGKPLPHVNDIVAVLKKEKVTVTIEDMGGPGMPQLMVKDSFMAEGQKLAGAKPAVMQAYAKRAQIISPATSALRDDVMTVNQAIQAGMMSTQACSGSAKGFSTMLGAVENGGETPPDDLFEVYAKLLQANARSEATVAASIALVAVTQATIAGKNPKAVDQLLAGIQQLKDNPEKVTPETARKVYKAAGQSLIDGCQAQLDKYYADHPEAKKPDGPSPCSKEGLAKDKEKWNKGPGAKNEGGSGSVESGTGNIAADAAIDRLVPKDGIVGDTATALTALKNGDVGGALKGALKMVGSNIPFGGVLTSIIDLF
jgi:hypothetical protein